MERFGADGIAVRPAHLSEGRLFAPDYDVYFTLDEGGGFQF